MLVEDAAAHWPDRTHLLVDGASYTFADTARRVAAARASLLRAGIASGDVVALLAETSADGVAAWLGIVTAGAIVIGLNPALSPVELDGLLRQSGARLLLHDEETAGIAKTLTAQVGMLALSVGSLQTGPDDALCPLPAADDICVLVNTSGTTSAPKLVMHAHESCILAAEGFVAWMGLTGEDRMFTCLPLFHINASIYSLLGSLAGGVGLAMVPRFSASRFWQQVRETGATQFNGIGAMIEILMAQAPSAAERDHLVKLCYSVPAQPESRHREIEQRFGFRLISGYALSESPYGTVWRLDDPPRYGSAGRLRQHPVLGVINEARLVDEVGREVAVGEPGELLLRSPAVTRGYYNNPEATAQALRDGWLYTGDLLRRDEDGYFYFVSRKKDVIRRRGEILAAAEVEDVLLDHPSIAEAAVVGVPSKLSDEEIKAFVVLRPAAAASAADIAAWCRQRLARFKLPRYIEFVDSLPRTPTMRIQKQLLSRERTSREHDLDTASDGRTRARSQR